MRHHPELPVVKVPHFVNQPGSQKHAPRCRPGCLQLVPGIDTLVVDGFLVRPGRPVPLRPKTPGVRRALCRGHLVDLDPKFRPRLR